MIGLMMVTVIKWCVKRMPNIKRGRNMKTFHKYNDKTLWDLVKTRYWGAINHRKESVMLTIGKFDLNAKLRNPTVVNPRCFKDHHSLTCRLQPTTFSHTRSYNDETIEKCEIIWRFPALGYIPQNGCLRMRFRGTPT